MAKFYITTSIPYVNGAPHIGHALEFAEADAVARWQRKKGDNVFFLTGTDEHGAKNVRSAEAVGKSPKEFVDGQAEQFRNLLEKLFISHDDFIRTSDKKRHWPGAQELWRRIAEQGDIYKGTYKGLYCIGHEAFVTEKDLVRGVCEDHGKPPEEIEEENYFFRLSEYGAPIQNLIESGEFSIMPEKRKNEVLAFLAGGAEDISFSRPSKDIAWGVPVPNDDSQTMYVWCDALSNYISALGFGRNDTERFETYWPADMHVIGKDILRFHAVIWPAMLLSAGLPLPRRLFVHGHIHSEGKKMSKSLGNVIDPFKLVEIYGAEAVRYMLLGAVSATEDTNLSAERIREIYTADLANGIGNLVSRVAAMAVQYFKGVLKRPSHEAVLAVLLRADIDVLGATNRELEVNSISVHQFIEREIIPAYEDAWKNYKIDNALREVTRLTHVLDRYIQAYEPYKLIKTNEAEAQAVLWEAAYALYQVADLLRPFMPTTAEQIEARYKKEDEDTMRVSQKEPLFPRIG